MFNHQTSITCNITQHDGLHEKKFSEKHIGLAWIAHLVIYIQFNLKLPDGGVPLQVLWTPMEECNVP